MVRLPSLDHRHQAILNASLNDAVMTLYIEPDGPADPVQNLFLRVRDLRLNAPIHRGKLPSQPATTRSLVTSALQSISPPAWFGLIDDRPWCQSAFTNST